MKKIAAIIVTLLLFNTVSTAALGAASPATGAGTSTQPAGSRIYVVSGDVFVSQGKNPAHRVINSEPVGSGTLINTGAKSSALLRFADGQVVTMQANSMFQVREYRYDPKSIEKSNIVFSMFKGGMRFVTGLIGQQRKLAFRLATPSATIGIRGTDFMVTMVGKSMYGQVLAGKIEMTNIAGAAVVGAGQTAVVASSKALASLVSASAIPAGTFSELLSIPLLPSAVPAHVPPVALAAVPAAVRAPVPVPVPAPVRAPVRAPAPAAAPAPAPVRAAAPVPAPAPETAKTADKEKMGMESRTGMSMIGKVGTLGYGAELNFGISDNIGARVGFNAYSYKNNATASMLNYDYNWQLQTFGAIADWYPAAGGFRASGGLLYNNNKNSYVANPTNGSYIINGSTYSTTQISSYQGTIYFNKISPYVGIGWGNPSARNKGWGLVSDIGLLYQGDPASDLVVTCAGTCPAQLQADASAENAKLQAEFSHYKWWPVASVGISYQW